MTKSAIIMMRITNGFMATVCAVYVCCMLLFVPAPSNLPQLITRILLVTYAVTGTCLMLTKESEKISNHSSVWLIVFWVLYVMNFIV